MERKIGEVFNDGPAKLEVVASRSCIGCYYGGKFCGCTPILDIRGECARNMRSDNASEIFKEVKT